MRILDGVDHMKDIQQSGHFQATMNRGRALDEDNDRQRLAVVQKHAYPRRIEIRAHIEIDYYDLLGSQECNRFVEMAGACDIDVADDM